MVSSAGKTCRAAHVLGVLSRRSVKPRTQARSMQSGRVTLRVPANPSTSPPATRRPRQPPTAPLPAAARHQLPLAALHSLCSAICRVRTQARVDARVRRTRRMRHQPPLSQRAADRNGWRGAGPRPRPALSGRLPSTCSCSSTGKVAELESPGARSLPPAALLRVQPPHPPCAPVPRAQPSCRPRGFGLGSPAPSLYVHPCRPMHAHRAASVARCLPRPPPTHTHSHPPHTLPSLSQPCAPRQ